MPLAKHDDVIQQLAAQRTHPSFGVSVLPRRTRRDADRADAQVVHPRGTRCRRWHRDLGSAAPARSPRRWPPQSAARPTRRTGAPSRSREARAGVRATGRKTHKRCRTSPSAPSGSRSRSCPRGGCERTSSRSAKADVAAALPVTRESPRPPRYAGRRPMQPVHLRECLANEFFVSTGLYRRYPSSGDTVHDRVVGSDGVEIASGHDPHVPQKFPRIVVLLGPSRAVVEENTARRLATLPLGAHGVNTG
jgi:hypothetical protein